VLLCAKRSFVLFSKVSQLYTVFSWQCQGLIKFLLFRLPFPTFRETIVQRRITKPCSISSKFCNLCNCVIKVTARVILIFFCLKNFYIAGNKVVRLNKFRYFNSAVITCSYVDISKPLTHL